MANEIPGLGARISIQQGGSSGLGRDAKGQFTTLQHRIEQVNRRLAAELANAVADQAERGRLDSRKSAATHALSNALRSEENQFYSVAGFGVGNPAFLSREVPYWWAINDGTSIFVGRYIRFLKRGMKSFPDPHGGNIRMAQQQVNSKGQARLTDEYGSFRSAKDAKQTTQIKRPIQAQHYFEKAVEKFDVPGQIKKALTAIIQEERSEG